MKKLLSLLLALVILFSFTACTSVIPSVQPEPEFSLGTTVENTYESRFIGLGIELDSDWAFYTDEEIKELNNITTDLMADEYEEMLKDADLIYDMFAHNTTDYSNINVILEKHDKGKYTEETLLKLLEAHLPELEDALSSMGFQKVKESDVSITEIAGERFPSTKMYSSIGDQNFYQMQFCKKVGEYLAIITVSSSDETELNYIINKFYTID